MSLRYANAPPKRGAKLKRLVLERSPYAAPVCVETIIEVGRGVEVLPLPT
jgi:hypothetical protein